MAETLRPGAPGQIAPPPSALAPARPADTLRRRLSVLLNARYGVYTVLVLLVIASAIITMLGTGRNVFISRENIFTNVLVPAALLGICAIGQTIVIITGGIDLSVASVIATVSVVAAYVMAGNDAMVLPVGLLLLAMSAGIGLVNGVLIAKRGIPPFIMTLASMIIIQGARFLYSGGAPRGQIPPALRFLGRGDMGPLPTAVVIVLLLGIATTIILNKTTFGRQLYAVGGNARAARLSGVNVDRIVIAAYVICGFLAGVTGLVLTGYIGVADNWLGKGFDLDSIAAAVVGGAMFSGGRGSVWGTLAGVLIIAILFNVVNLLALDSQVQLIIKGVVIVGAVALYSRTQNR